MSLSENIKRMRIANNMTQEQLATKLGISSQAVSKWETSETYPDGILLVPLAQALNASLDELFENKQVTIEDISKKIMRILAETNVKDRFNLVRDICWQIEKGLFRCDCKMIEEEYASDEIMNQTNSSYILNDYGFTLISNGKEPFFSVFPEPTEGFGDFIKDIDKLQKMFASLSSSNTLQVIIFLLKQKWKYVFEPDLLIKECNIPKDELQEVIEDLVSLKLVECREVDINGKQQTLCYSHPDFKMLVLFIIAREVKFEGNYSLQSIHREKCLIQNSN